MLRQLILLFLVLTTWSGLRAQSSWVSISAPRGNFSFSFPASTTPLDTLGLLSYSYALSSDTTITFQVHFMDNVPVSANPDLQAMLDSAQNLNTGDTIGEVLNVYAQLFQQFTSGTIEGFTDTTYQSRIRGEELSILHPSLTVGDSTNYFDFTRYYYYNSKFLAFTLTGPQTKLSVLNGYKNQLFSSIGISW